MGKLWAYFSSRKFIKEHIQWEIREIFLWEEQSPHRRSLIRFCQTEKQPSSEFTAVRNFFFTRRSFLFRLFSLSFIPYTREVDWTCNLHKDISFQRKKSSRECFFAGGKINLSSPWKTFKLCSNLDIIVGERTFTRKTWERPLYTLRTQVKKHHHQSHLRNSSNEGEVVNLTIQNEPSESYKR